MDLVLILIATLPLMPIARSGGTAEEKLRAHFERGTLTRGRSGLKQRKQSGLIDNWNL